MTGINNTYAKLLLDICRPSDWHHHFREGQDWLSTTAPLCFSQFHYAVAMPNLTNPVRTYQHALEYQREIRAEIPHEFNSSEPCMTYYLSPSLAQQDILIAANDPEHRVVGVKYYPQGATTNSAHGVSDYRQVREQLQAIESTTSSTTEGRITLMIHGEDPIHPDIFTREKRFMTDPDHGQLRPIMEEFSALRITLEHISSSTAAQVLSDDWAISKSSRLAATITPHHLKYTTSDIFGAGCCSGGGIGIRPHMFCCPILKSKDDLDALQELAVGGHSNIFLGTDCAPHTDAVKQTLGRPGVFNIHSALSDVTEIFVNANRIARLEGFTSLNGCEWYNKPAPHHLRTRIYSISNHDDQPIVPKVVFVGNDPNMRVTPMRPGARLPYSVVANQNL